MQVSVVVPTYRRPDLLRRCLEALLRQRYEPDQFEIIVADDAVEAATKQLVKSFAGSCSSVLYVPVSARHGPAAARNTGWRLASGAIIAFTDDDCLPDSWWLAAGARAFAHPEVVAVTGKTIVPLSQEPTDYERNTAGLEASEFITANCFVRRGALADLGGFDESFTTAWREDSDLHFRLLDTGGKIVRVNDAVVVHPARQAPWCASLREQQKATFDALLYRKHPRHFRQRIQPRWPARYYLMAACVAAATGLMLAGQHFAGLVALGAWLALTLQFIALRLHNTSRDPRHVAEMVVTSLMIPFLSIYWRLLGAVRYRTMFW
jgi:glycosyltransferase involved in cell wall biosynthesis